MFDALNPAYPTTCSICGAPCGDDPQARYLRILCGELAIFPPDDWKFAALDDDRAAACGQYHALMLTERFLERGTFAPADFQPPAPSPDPDALTQPSAEHPYAALT